MAAMGLFTEELEGPTRVNQFCAGQADSVNYLLQKSSGLSRTPIQKLNIIQHSLLGMTYVGLVSSSGYGLSFSGT